MVYAGLCGSCRNARVIGNRRGSRFTICELSRTDQRFPRYPRLPVLRCIGFAPVLDTGSGTADPVTPPAPDHETGSNAGGDE
jgi:hypothetical protein